MVSVTCFPGGKDCVIFFLWHFQTGSLAVTFFCAEVHFNSGVSTGVQDLPGNYADDRHPERHRQEKQPIVNCF